MPEESSSPKRRARPLRRPLASATEEASSPASALEPGGLDDAASREPPSPLEPGERLKLLRLRYGFSQRELASRTGLTNGAISLMEQGKVSPSVSSLKRVLAGFPISLSEFFADNFDASKQVFFRASELTEIGGEGLSLRQVGSASLGRKLEVLHERYARGGDTGPEMLSHEGEEAGIVVRGRVEVTVGGRTEILGPGDAYHFDSRIPHRFRNIDDVEAEIVSACTPPSF